jgi:hypothetical protein
MSTVASILTLPPIEVSVEVRPSGVDDTAATLAICASGRIAKFIDGQTYHLNQIALTAVDSGGIEAWGAKIRRVSSWAPAIGLVADRTNAWITLTGQAGAYSGSIAATTTQRGADYIAGVGSTTGLAAGAFVRAKSSPLAGVTLTESAFLMCLSSVPSSTTLRTVRGTTIPIATSTLASVQLPMLLQEVTPVRRFFIEGGDWDTEGANVATLVTMTDCYGTGAGRGHGVGSIRFEGIAARGFTLFAIDTQYSHGYRIKDCYSNGLINGFHRATSSHDWQVDGWTSDPNGEPYHTNGPVQTQFYAWCGSSDYVITNCHGVNVASMFHSQGGWNVTYGTNTGRMLKPSIRVTRDPEINGNGIAFGAMYDGCVLAVPHTEYGFGYDLGNMHCAETYYDNGGGAIDIGVGAFAYYYHDVYTTSVGIHSSDNAGHQSGGTLNGSPYNPVGGAMVRDNIGGSIGSLRFRNSALGLGMNGLGGYAWAGGTYVYESTAGISLAGSTQSMKLDTGGADACIKWESMCIPQSASIFFGSAFVSSPDYNWWVGSMVAGNEPPYQNVVVAQDNSNAGAPVSPAFQNKHIAKLDATVTAPARRIILAGAGDPSPVVVVMGSEVSMTTVKLISLGGMNNVLVSGAAACGDRLVAEGGTNHKAIVDNTAACTAHNIIGRVLNGHATGGACRVKVM